MNGFYDLKNINTIEFCGMLKGYKMEVNVFSSVVSLSLRIEVITVEVQTIVL